MSLPAAAANDSWAQSGGNASKSVGHVALGQSLGVAWTVSIGKGSDKDGRLGGGPVVADGKVFTMDTTGHGPRVRRRQRRPALVGPVRRSRRQ